MLEELSQESRHTGKESGAGATHILLVEDHPANILVAKSYLEMFGYPYTIAHNGREAVEKYKISPYQLILMDIQMPDLDGYEATRMIRDWEKVQGLPSSPIIAMTSFSRIEDRSKCMNAGMNEYISKPFRPGELQKKIEMFLPTTVSAG